MAKTPAQEEHPPQPPYTHVKQTHKHTACSNACPYPPAHHQYVYNSPAHHQVTLVWDADGVALQHPHKINAPVQQALPQCLGHERASQQHLGILINGLCQSVFWRGGEAHRKPVQKSFILVFLFLLGVCVWSQNISVGHAQRCLDNAPHTNAQQ